MESDNDCLPAGAGFFDQGVGDALGDFALLVGCAALQKGNLNERHLKPSLVVCRW